MSSRCDITSYTYTHNMVLVVSSGTTRTCFVLTTIRQPPTDITLILDPD